MAQKTIAANAEKIVTVPYGERIAVGTWGGGIAKIYYESTPGSIPPSYYFVQNLSNDQVTLGTFARDMMVRIAAGSNEVLYNVGVSPDVGAGVANSVSTLSALREYSAYGQPVYVSGHTARNDGGQGWFEYFDSSLPGTYTDDNGCIIVSTGGDGSTAWIRSTKGAINVKWYGAKGDGVTNDYTAINNAVVYANSTTFSKVVIPTGTYLTNSTIYVESNTTISGEGVHSTKIIHPLSSCLRNENWTTGTGDNNITIEDISFSGDNTFDSSISFNGVRDISCKNLFFEEYPTTGVTVAIGISDTLAIGCYNINVTNCDFDIPDYGIVFQSQDGNEVENAFVSNCRFRTLWGSGISVSGNVSDITITGNQFTFTGDPDPVSGNVIGIGIKLWEGDDIDNSPTNIVIAGNNFKGVAVRDNLAGVSAANWTKNLNVTGNTFIALNYAFYNNFAGSNADNIIFTSNTVKDCDNGFFNDNSSDVKPMISDNTFLDCENPIHSSLNHGIVSNNQIRDCGNQAIWCENPCTFALISGNNLWNIGREAVYIESDGANSSNVSIVGNVIHNCCIGADNTYSVIYLNNQAHTVTSNYIVNDSTTIKPIWIIGSLATADNRLINDNWMYGARSGYRQISGVSDVYQDNRERGGIG